MSDVVSFTEGGRTYRVMGLQARAQAIAGACQEMDSLISDRIRVANTALDTWEGEHAATFAEGLNDVLSQMAGLKVGLWHASNVLASFPDAPTRSVGTMHHVDSIYLSARVTVPAGNGTAAATPRLLREYTTTASGQDERFTTLVNTVNLDGVTAEVSYERPLSGAERQRALDNGASEHEVFMMTATATEGINDVAALIPLPTPKPKLPSLKAASQAVGEFATAVAYAFDNADQPWLNLLADYPELAGFIIPGMGSGRVSGESALAILLAYFDRFDTAAHGGDEDGIVSLGDLDAMANEAGLPAYAREAAQYLIDNPVLFGLAETIGDPLGDTLGRAGDGKISAEDIRTFLEFNQNLRVVEQNFDTFDIAAHGGDVDGDVSIDDLEAVAAGSGALARAAQWLLDHPTQLRRLTNYEFAKKTDGVAPAGPPGLFNHNALIGLAIDQQIYGDDPEAAHQFVNRLPVASNGEKGVPIWLASDEGAKNLANAALIDSGGDLTESHSVIAHLPETTGGVRNQLITGFYDTLARRADTLFAGDLAGDPEASGHPGANWLLMAPWASDTAGDAITGNFSAWGMGATMGERQAMADGNQWIFNDIGARYAAFIEMYESNRNPGEHELEAFFTNNFDEGDSQIRTGFSAYTATMEEADPARQQQLMFEANTLVAMHEQAGVQPYLEKLDRWYVPKEIERRYFDTSIDGQRYDLDMTVPDTDWPNNSIDDVNLLDLDPGGKDPSNYVASAPTSTRFSVGETSSPGLVDLNSISGIESWDDEFPTSTQQMWEEGAGGGSPDGVEGSDASSWQDRNERMYYILKLFEQNHTNPRLYRTDRHDLNLDDIEWLDSATGLG